MLIALFRCQNSNHYFTVYVFDQGNLSSVYMALGLIIKQNNFQHALGLIKNICKNYSRLCHKNLKFSASKHR